MEWFYNQFSLGFEYCQEQSICNLKWYSGSATAFERTMRGIFLKKSIQNLFIDSNLFIL